MLKKRKKTLTAEVAALREEVRELRRVLEAERRPTAPLPGEGEVPGKEEVIDVIVDEATRIAHARDDLARQLKDAKEQIAALEKRNPAAG
jgi:archaellum component FlaC